jgi:integrase/recombinase XerD
MPGKTGFAAVEALRKRTGTQARLRGGQPRQVCTFERTGADALIVWSETWLAQLRARNYAPGTLDYKEHALRLFMHWAAERGVARAGEVTRPMLEAYQRYLWHARRSDPAPVAVASDAEATPPAPTAAKASQEGRSKPLGWSTQRQHLGCLKDWFKWLTRQNVLLHNPASELEMPRPEKRLPVAALTLLQIEKLMAVPDIADPLGLRDRAMLEILYATGIRRAELCALDCSDISPERGTLTVRRGKGRKDRVVPLV